MSAKSRLRKILRSIAVAGAVFGVVMGLYASTFVLSYGALFADADPLLVTDVGRVTPALVEAIYEVQDVDEIGAALADARERGLKVSIAGSRHSQGGQTYAEGGVVLSMRGFNRILAVDPVGQTITVESGATWDEVQRAQGIAMMIARPSIDPDPDEFLREMVVVTWRRDAPGIDGEFELTEEERVLRDRFFFGLSRRFDWAKSLRWNLQKRWSPPSRRFS